MCHTLPREQPLGVSFKNKWLPRGVFLKIPQDNTRVQCVDFFDKLKEKEIVLYS